VQTCALPIWNREQVQVVSLPKRSNIFLSSERFGKSIAGISQTRPDRKAGFGGIHGRQQDVAARQVVEAGEVGLFRQRRGTCLPGRPANVESVLRYVRT